MRTTVTLDPDVERLLKETAHRTRQSFKEVLNNAVRQGLSVPKTNRRSKRFVVMARPLGLRPGIDPARLSELADDLEIDAFLAQSRQKKS